MTNITLHNHYYMNINTVAWCATAEIVTPQISIQNQRHSKREQQRDGVRLLLKTLLNRLNIIDILDESKFPYRLVNSGFYVCFSHSGDSRSNNRVAVAINRYYAIGIDIETRNIAWSVAQRFYHVNEIATLAALPIKQRTSIVKQLWQIKESIIKIKQYKLAQGLGVDYVTIIPALVEGHLQIYPASLLLDKQMQNYHITVLTTQQTIIVSNGHS